MSYQKTVNMNLTMRSKYQGIIGADIQRKLTPYFHLKQFFKQVKIVAH